MNVNIVSYRNLPKLSDFTFINTGILCKGQELFVKSCGSAADDWAAVYTLRKVVRDREGFLSCDPA